MIWKASAAGLGVWLSLVLSIAPASAETRALSYQMLLAVDDPAKPAPTGAPLPAVKSEEVPNGLDTETPGALRYGGAEPAAAVTDEAAEKAAKKNLDDEESSVFKTWWFWALAAGVVGGTVALGVWAAQPTDTPSRPCPAGVAACFGDGRN